ncbi:MAG TPA: SRPBCC family protein [Gemmatimonadaceae bacterium]|nr:SRPBCC family protein [Gemmatimonadaceae bacterium]
MTSPARADLGPMPMAGVMVTVDELRTDATPDAMFAVVRDVASWPRHLAHYRHVRFHARDASGGDIVEMAAWRPFGPMRWPTWWLSEMAVVPERRVVRFRHIGGITTGMDVEWRIDPLTRGSHVTLTHVWNGPRWPLIGRAAARAVIGPVFVHGIASRTLAGLARAAVTAR